MQNVTIPLAKPVELFNMTITSVIVNEPTGGLYLDHGPPLMRAQMRDGTVFGVDDKAAIKAYIDRCVVADGINPGHGLTLVAQMVLDDAAKVRATLMGFFYGGEDSSPPNPSAPSSTDSSSI